MVHAWRSPALNVGCPDYLWTVAQVMHLWMASHMLVDMKRKELRHKARQRARAEREAAPAARETKKTS